jgi:hypothetical protein
MEFIEDRTKFKKYVSEATQNNKGKLKNKSYKLPAEVNNITTSPPSDAGSQCNTGRY